jgi:hypothetical protein
MEEPIMKRMLIPLLLCLVLVLTACGAPAKKATAQPTSPPQPTQVPPTKVPVTDPSDTPVPAEEPTAEEPVAEPTEEPTAGEAPTAPTSFGQTVFTQYKGDVTFGGTVEVSATDFAAKCDTLPDTITITVTVDNADIYKVNYSYRLTNVATPLISTGWSGDAKMEALGDGNFKLDFPASRMSGDARLWKKAWFDLQLIAFDNKDVRYLSQQFVKLINYSYKCPE